MTPSVRVLKLVQKLIAQPFELTRGELMEELNMSQDEMKGAVRAIKAAGLDWQQEKGKYYRCAIIPNDKFDELRHLQPLTDIERGKISSTLHKNMGSSREATLLMNKLNSLYDFQRLGIRALRKPELEKLDRLKYAREHKKRVILTNYHSNSNTKRNRIVQPFHISTILNTVQALDVEEDPKQIKHFMIPRIGKVVVTGDSWTDEHLQFPQATDIFKIADNEQVMVHLQLDVYAYNLLTEQFPLSKSSILEDSTPNLYDLQCLVNHRFLGLMNFILSNWNHVEIISPNNLREEVLARAKKIQKKFSL